MSWQLNKRFELSLPNSLSSPHKVFPKNTFCVIYYLETLKIEKETKSLYEKKKNASKRQKNVIKSQLCSQQEKLIKCA